ncbi:MAG TPA: hypothetical protein VGE76_09665 [Opitutaceae bacterium]
MIVEARAEIIWGKSREKVLALLQQKGIGDKDALALSDELMAERAAIIRDEGRKKIGWGIAFVAAPVTYYFVGLLMGFWFMKLLAALIVLGVYGVGKITTGAGMVTRPGRVRGDLANSD